MSGLGSSAEDIRINALSLIEHQIMTTGNKPVGVLTAQEVKKIDEPVWEKVVDHVRLYGESSVCLVSDQDFSACGGTEEEPELYYVGSTQVASIQYEGTTKAFYIMHSNVPESVFRQFIQEVKETSEDEKEARGEEACAISLVKLKKDVDIQRKLIEDEAIKRCTDLRESAEGLLVGYVTTEEKFGYQHDTFHEVDGDTEGAYRFIRGGAKPVFEGEHNILRNVCEEYVREKHYLGSTQIGVHSVDRTDKSNKLKKQFFIFETPVTLNDFHRFLNREKKMESKVKVFRDKKAVENIYWAGKPKKKTTEVPVFGFD